MAVLKKIVFGLIALLVALILIAFVLPPSSRVERSIVINAPAAKVFAVMRDFQQFNQWSPWAELDPNTHYTFSGNNGEVGAKYEWRGNSAVGAGSQEITALELDKSVTIHLIFEGQSDAQVSYQLLEQNGTQVIWTFDTQHGMDPLSRWFGLVLDKFIGADYENGLAKLKTYIENLPAESAVPNQMEVAPVPEQTPLPSDADTAVLSEEDSAGEPPSEDDATQ